MTVCCCSLAGTRACNNCGSGVVFRPVEFEVPSSYKPVENMEDMVRRISKEEIDKENEHAR